MSVICLSGCGPQIFDPPQIDATDPSPITTGENPNAEDGAADDTGAVLGTGGDRELVDGCLINDDEFFGYVHQCEGIAIVRAFEDGIFQIGDQWGGDFGPDVDGDSYGNPKVMACCDVYEEPPPAQEHFYNCSRDNLDQFCNNASAHVLRVWGGDEDEENDEDAMALAEWVGSPDGIVDCQSMLHNAAVMTWEPLDIMTHDSLNWVIGAWVGDAPEEQWSSISNPSFSVGAIIDAVYVPEDSQDYIECIDIYGNNNQMLLPSDESSGYRGVLDEADAVLLGPTYATNPVSANPEFSSTDTSCIEPMCSTIAFSYDAPDWTLESLSYYSAGNTAVGDGGQILYTVERLAIELVLPCAAATLGTDVFEVASGDALFAIAGTLDGVPHRTLAFNASPIRIRKVGNVWKNGSFAVQYVDSEADAWTLTVSLADWEVE